MKRFCAQGRRTWWRDAVSRFARSGERDDLESVEPRAVPGFSLIEALVVIGIVAILALLAPSIVKNSIGGCGPPQVLTNMKQLHLATQQMVLDGENTGDAKLRWPGDTGGSFSNWARTIVPAYLSTNDFCKLLSGPGKIVPAGSLPPNNTTAVLVYAVRANSDPSTVFLSSANFTNTPVGGHPLNPAARPYGAKGFVVFHKAGDGAILNPKQVGDTNRIGASAPLCW